MTGPLILACRHACGGASYETHFHNDYELLYVRGGAVRLLVGADAYTVRAPALCFISRFEEHAVEVICAPYERGYVILCAEAADRLIGDARLCSIFKNRPAGFKHVFPCDPAETDRLFAALAGEAERPGPYSDEYAACLLRALLILTYRAGPQRFPFPERAVRGEIHEVQRYIEGHYADQLRISELAARFYIDPNYLSHQFKAVTGYSPKQYLMLSRLSRARELLIASALPVREVAERAGFRDVNNFIRSFKRETGITPAQYRRPGGDAPVVEK